LSNFLLSQPVSLIWGGLDWVRAAPQRQSYQGQPIRNTMNTEQQVLTFYKLTSVLLGLLNVSCVQEEMEKNGAMEIVHGPAEHVMQIMF